MRFKNILIVVFAVLLVAVAASSWWLRPADMASLGMEATPLLYEGRGSCDAARGHCEFRDGPLRISFELPVPVQSLRPLELRLGVEGIRPQQLILTFTMADMDMGLNRFVLRQDEAGEWRGQAMLPVCSAGRKDWLASLSLMTPQGRYLVVFPFTAQ